MNYTIVPLNGGNQFDLSGVRFRDKSFMFWKKKSNQPINEIMVVFDKKYENIEIRDGVLVLSLKGLTNYNDLREAFNIFLLIVKNKNINVRFIIDNEQTRQIADSLGKEFGVVFVVQDINKKNRQNVGPNLKQMEEDIKNKKLMVGNTQMIEKYDNGVLKQITVDKSRGVAYENNGMLNSEEEEISLLREWMKDPVKREELSKLSVEERNELLTKEVMSNRKQYRMESVNKVVSNDMVGDAAIAKANLEDGLVNTELGITKNNISNENQYSVVEKNGDKVQIVDPEVVNYSISSTGGRSSNVSSDKNYSSTNYNVVEYEEEQKREVISDKVLYLDSEYNIYDSNVSYDKPIGKIGSNGYELDFENNCIVRNGKFEGYVGNYNEMDKANSNVYEKPKVRTLEKDDKSSGLISFPVIIFILSTLLLIGSATLLFLVG